MLLLIHGRNPCKQVISSSMVWEVMTPLDPGVNPESDDYLLVHTDDLLVDHLNDNLDDHLNEHLNYHYNVVDIQLAVLCHSQRSPTVLFWNSLYMVCPLSPGRAILFQTQLLLLFLHKSHGTKEIPNCGNLVRPD